MTYLREVMTMAGRGWLDAWRMVLEDGFWVLTVRAWLWLFGLGLGRGLQIPCFFACGLYICPNKGLVVGDCWPVERCCCVTATYRTSAFCSVVFCGHLVGRLLSALRVAGYGVYRRYRRYRFYSIKRKNRNYRAVSVIVLIDTIEYRGPVLRWVVSRAAIASIDIIESLGKISFPNEFLKSVLNRG